MRIAHAKHAFRTPGRPVAVLLALAVIGVTAAAAPARTTQRAAVLAVPKPVKAAKLDSALARVAGTARSGGARAALKNARTLGLEVRGSRIEVQVDARDPVAATAAVRAAGGTVVARYRDLLDATVPAAGLSRLAGSRAVRAVEQQSRPHAAAVLDEARREHGSGHAGSPAARRAPACGWP